LREAAAACPFAGDALVHFDLRSDNVCIRDGRALIVDWNWAAVGEPTWDLAGWLASLAAEGGPQPEELLRGGGPYAAVVAGYFAARAGLPPPPTADPSVRDLQLSQLREARPWAARELRLPTP